jgi:hypothetical protein
LYYSMQNVFCNAENVRGCHGAVVKQQTAEKP